MLAAVVFDFDGIIVDSEPMHFRAFNEVLKPLGIEILWDDYCSTYIGFDDRDAFRTVLKNNKKKICTKDLKHLIEEKAAIFQKYVQKGEATPLPGAVELIKSIPVRLPVALCSGALREDIIPVIEKLGIDHAFSAIVTAEDTPKSKPDPAPYRLTLEKLGIDDPASVIAIEDTPAGIMSAKGAGLKVLAVTNSYDREYLMEADAVTDSLEHVSRPDLENMVM
ncbi:Phosphorylated carbohydrates phosphatase [Pontiella desulfatans]|uniref:Phosphorylated carbohydrates phosphatase n=1 Tax=Pontiella desulfatans TaxID=2750659 RepID=A0A6C2TY86_PONDE|nr:HAD family phosphatase [Pontiella desulfatans]VGO12698.1 Phosphorylated carbohydrates phosphatase [Pontiella desulfatans]